MDDDKVVYLNRGKKKFEDELLELAKAFEGEAMASEQQEKISTVSITGSNNIVGNGNTVNHIVTVNRPAKKVVQVQTGNGVVDAMQKHQIKTMLYEWVDMHKAVKKSPLSYQAAWIKLNGYLKVSSYHEIKQEDFPKAIKWLRTKQGTLRSMPSAPKKMGDWRMRNIKSIQARCSEKGWQAWRKEHMMEKFGKTSLKDLTDPELKQLYQTVWNKK